MERMDTRSSSHASSIRLDRVVSAGAHLRRIYAERTVLGTFLIELPTPRTVRAIALAGFDFVVIDLEHSPFGFSEIPALVAEANATGLVALIRPWTIEPGLIGKLLDSGAHGILAPKVDSVSAAELLVRSCRYLRGGERGVCPVITYEALEDPQQTIDRDTLVFAQIEGRDGLNAVGSIAGVPGLDGLFVGPYDLSQSLEGRTAVDGDAVAAAAKQVRSSAQPGQMLGVYVHDPTKSPIWSDRGFRFQCISLDGRMLLDGARSAVALTRSATAAVGSVPHDVSDNNTELP